MEWIYRGRAFKFGDNVHIDGEIMPLRFMHARETDPEILKNHVMEGIDPDFPKKVRPGDLIVAGGNFAHGNPHAQGFRGIKALGLGIVAEWIPRGAYRNCVVAGIPTIARAEGISTMVTDGDQLEVDFQTGHIRNLTTGAEMRGETMPPLLQAIIAAGGASPFMRRELIRRGKVKEGLSAG